MFYQIVVSSCLNWSIGALTRKHLKTCWICVKAWRTTTSEKENNRWGTRFIIARKLNLFKVQEWLGTILKGSSWITIILWLDTIKLFSPSVWIQILTMLLVVRSDDILWVHSLLPQHVSWGLNWRPSSVLVAGSFSNNPFCLFQQCFEIDTNIFPFYRMKDWDV